MQSLQLFTVAGMNLGEAVRSMRVARGWRLEDLSERSGVDVGTISALENRNSTRSKYAKALADAFGCSVDALLSGGDYDAAEAASADASQWASIHIGPVDLGEVAESASTEELMHIKQLVDQAQMVLVKIRSRLPTDRFLQAMQAAEDTANPKKHSG